MGPGEVAKFGLLQNFRKILAGFDVFEVDVEPVGAGLGQAVREDGSVLSLIKNIKIETAQYLHK